MTDEQKPEKHFMKVNLRPFEHPDADDYYANLTGVATMQHEIILLFGRVLPLASAPESGEMDTPPQVRVTLATETARSLLEQLRMQLDARDKVDDEDRRKEAEGAGNSGTHQ